MRYYRQALVYSKYKLQWQKYSLTVLKEQHNTLLKTWEIKSN
jgi:hypothetical protein